MSKFVIIVVLVAVAASSAAAEKSISSVYGGDDASRAVGMANKWVGGAASVEGASLMDFIGRRDPVSQLLTWNWQLAGGPSTVGLQTRIWGKVTAVYSSPVTGAKWFYVDDGSRCVSDFGDVGVLVYSDEEVEVGQFVTLTGVADVEQSQDSPGRLVRVIRCVPERQRSGPFSDEFDSGTLNPGWVVVPSPLAASLSTEPGYLTLQYVYQAARGMAAAQVLQPAPGNWQMELLMRIGTPPLSGSAFMGVDPPTGVHGTSPTMLFISGGSTYSIRIGGVQVGELAGNQLWVRGRSENGTYTQSYSLDGISYSAEYSGPSSDDRYFQFGLYSEFGRVAVDYVRFRPL